MEENELKKEEKEEKREKEDWTNQKWATWKSPKSPIDSNQLNLFTFPSFFFSFLLSFFFLSFFFFFPLFLSFVEWIMDGFDQAELSKDPTLVFDVLEKLGEGSYGEVLKARHKVTGKIYAVK
jgi:hypothetical protein